MLRPSDTLLRSCPLGHILKCRGIASAVPLIVDKIEVNLDFHIFNILDFDLLLGSPFEKLLISYGSLDKKLRKTASTTVSCLENSMAKHFPEPNPLKEMVHESPFIPFESILFEVAKSATSEENNSEEILRFCEDEQSLSLLSEFVPLSSGPKEVVLDHDRDSTMISHDESLDTKNRRATKCYEAPTLESIEKDSIYEHGSFILVIPQKPCSFHTSPESGTHCAQSTHEDYNFLKVLSCKTFRRLVVDAYVYRKHCKFRGYSVVLTLQLNLHDTSTIGDEKGNTSSTIAARGCSHGRAYDQKQSTAGR